MSVPQNDTSAQETILSDVQAIAPHKTLWQNTNFMKFWMGESISLFGSQITLLALPLVAVLVLNANAEQLGWLRFLETAPYLLFPLLFGVWVDRHQKRPLMIVANVTRGILIAFVPLLAFLHLLNLVPLYLISFIVGIFTVLYDLCWLSFVPALVSKEHLMGANSRVTTSASAAEVAGPGLAGGLVQLLTAPLALLLDSLSYIVSVILLLSIRHQEPLPEEKQETSLLMDMREGFRFVWSNTYIRILAFQAGVWNFCYAIVDIAFLLYAIHQVGFTPGVLGIIYAVGAVGGVLGSTIANTLARRFPLGPMICATFTLGSVPFLLLPALTGSQRVLAIIFTMVFFLVRTALGIYAVQSTSLRQAVTPPVLMARMNAILRLISYGGGTFGPLAAGFLGTWIGARASLWVASIGFLLALVPLFLSPVRRMRVFPS